MIRWLLISALLLAWAGSAQADPLVADQLHARAEAERYATRAKAHYDAHQYDEAAMAYGEAYRIFPTAGLLYNLAQSYRLLGDCVAATTIYNHYLRRAPRSRYRTVVKRHLADLSACASEQTVVTASIGGGSDDPVAWSLLRIRGPRSPEVGRAERGARPGHGFRMAGVITTSGGVLFAGLGLYFAIDAEHAADEVATRYQAGADWEDIAELEARRERSTILGGTMLGLGAVAFATGVTLYALGWRDGQDGPSLAVSRRGEDGLEMKVSWRF